MRRILTLAFAIISALTAQAAPKDSAYVATIAARSAKVAAALNLNDADKSRQVTDIVVRHYYLLNDIYAERDSLMAIAKTLDEPARTAARQAADDRKDAQLWRKHFAFEAELSLLLTAAEIEKVKDALTYNVVHVTYSAQCDMIPTLKDDEKVQILAWLKEAREYAIDAESSKKKHETFGRYKGRINNYLTRRGYNLTKEREEWAKRVKARGGTL